MDTNNGKDYLEPDESLLNFVLCCRDCNSLLVCIAVFPDPRSKFWLVCGRDLRNADFQFFRGGLDCGLGDFPGLVVSRRKRTQGQRMVGRAAFEFGGGAVASAAAVFVEAA